MQCTAGMVLRRRHSGSTWTVLQVIFQLGALWLCTSENLLSSCGRRPVITPCFADSACCDRIFLPFDLVRCSCLPSDELGEWRILTGHPPCLCDRPSHCHGAPRKCNLAANNLLFLLLNPPSVHGKRSSSWTEHLSKNLWEDSERLECNSVQPMLSFVVCQQQQLSVFHFSG